MIKSYQSPLLNALPHIKHGFYTRLGGNSTRNLKGLNCGYGSDEPPEIIDQNRLLVAQDIGVLPENLLGVYQHHSPDVITIDKPHSHANNPKGDGMVTHQTGFALGILTADCAPVLFASKNNSQNSSLIASVHSGWRGARYGILGNTVQAFKENNISPDQIVSVIGPCIQQASYEVDKGFYQNFLDEDKDNNVFFIPSRKDGHYQFDLPAYIQHKLEILGIPTAQIDRIPQDTYTNEEEFYSYRRSTHRNEVTYGRQISVIAIT